MIEDVLANVAERITMLRVEGHPVQAASLDRAVAEMRAELPEYLTWLSEAEAMTYTGRKADYLRARFAGWKAREMAEWKGKMRYFRRCVLEHRGNTDAARAAGMRAGRGSAA